MPDDSKKKAVETSPEDQSKGLVRRFLEKLEEGLQDLTSLEVITATGNIKSVVKPNAKGTGMKVDFGKIFTGSEDNAKFNTEADIEIVSFTKFMVDFDAFHFVKKDITDLEAQLLDSHKDAIVAAQEARKNLFSLITGLVKKDK